MYGTDLKANKGNCVIRLCDGRRPSPCKSGCLKRFVAREIYNALLDDHQSRAARIKAA